MTLKTHLPVVSFGGTSVTVDSSGQHAQWLRLVRGLDEGWEVRGEDTVIPSAAGRVARNRVRDTLTIDLEGVIVGVGATPALQVANTRTRLTALRALFDPAAAPASLVVELEDGTEASITCRTLNLVTLDYPDPVYRPVSIELEAVGADWVIA